jgi:DNA-binding MarR family transcriptional regulator
MHDPSTPAGQLGLAFKRAMVAVRKLRGRDTTRPGQISYAQYGLLFGLSGMSECSARELAEHVDLTPATVAQMLEHLESAGLVTRIRSEEDRRVVLSALTEHGAAVVAERKAQMEPRWRQALTEFSDDELTAAARVLNRLADHFDEY